MSDLTPDQDRRLRELRREDLLPLTGQAFEAPEAPHPFVLRRLEDLGREDEEPTGRRPFSALFSQPGPGILPQRIYTLHHDAVGTLPLFLVPVGREGEDVLYEAVLR